MSSNGIGLQTARGSGTTGHIQKNVASNKDHASIKDDKSGHFRRRQLSNDRKLKYDKHISTRNNRDEAKQEIRSHDLKRDVEVKCMELRDALEDESEEELTIEKKVNELRDKLLNSPMTARKHTRLDDHKSDSSHASYENKINDHKDNDNASKNDIEDSFSYKRRYTDCDEKGERLKIRR